MPLTDFTISMASGLIRADSVSRTTVKAFSVSVPSLREEVGPSTQPVANDNVPVALSMGTVTTASVVQILTDEPVLVKLNGDTNGFPVDGLFELIGTAVTAIVVSNDGDNQAKVSYYLAGSS